MKRDDSFLAKLASRLPFPMESDVEEIMDEIEDEGEYLPFYVPNPDGSLKLYAKCLSENDWKDTYQDMCGKINKAKLSEDVKLNKLYDLQAANEELLKKFFDNVER